MSPVHPCTQIQLKPSSPSTQVPSFWQGELPQGRAPVQRKINQWLLIILHYALAMGVHAPPNHMSERNKNEMVNGDFTNN